MELRVGLRPTWGTRRSASAGALKPPGDVRPGGAMKKFDRA